MILKVNFQNDVWFKLRFKIKSSCSCEKLNRLKAFIYIRFSFAVQVVQVDFLFLEDMKFLTLSFCNDSLKINNKKNNILNLNRKRK